MFGLQEMHLTIYCFFMLGKPDVPLLLLDNFTGYLNPFLDQHAPTSLGPHHKGTKLVIFLKRWGVLIFGELGTHKSFSSASPRLIHPSLSDVCLRIPTSVLLMTN